MLRQIALRVRRVGFELVNAYRERVVHAALARHFLLCSRADGRGEPQKTNNRPEICMWSGVGAVINVEDNSSVLLPLREWSINHLSIFSIT
jgi:hypothetical protein